MKKFKVVATAEWYVVAEDEDDAEQATTECPPDYMRTESIEEVPYYGEEG